MIDIEERIDNATEAVRFQVNKVPMRPSSAVTRRHRPGRAASTVLIVAVVVTAFSAVGTLLSGESGIVSSPNAQSASTFTLDLSGWTLERAWEVQGGEGRSHTLFDRVEGDGPRRITIESGTAAADRLGTLQSLPIEPTATVTLDGSEAVFYDTSQLHEDEERAHLMAWATLVVTWVAPEGQPVVFLFERVGIDEARVLLSDHLAAVSHDGWESMVASYKTTVTTMIADE